MGPRRALCRRDAAGHLPRRRPGPPGAASPPSDRTRLEAILADLPAELFTADDALGWVYQFWQSEGKKEVNDAGRKIGGADLPPVTQLFTEHYMVRFLLENSLGAWWAGRHPESPLLREWEYLRFRDDGTPAAGTFEGWPERAAEITVMDPCWAPATSSSRPPTCSARCGWRRRASPPPQAADAVLRDNLFGLELDPRCTQIAAFALAFDAWKAGGYQQLPVPNIACSGIAVKGQLDDWRRLAGDDANMAAALERLYDLFQDAPELGSLIDPTAAAGDGLWAVDPTSSRPSSRRPSRRRPRIPPPPSSVLPPRARPRPPASLRPLLAGRHEPAVPGRRRIKDLVSLATILRSDEPRHSATWFVIVARSERHQAGSARSRVRRRRGLLPGYSSSACRLSATRCHRCPIARARGPGHSRAISGEVVNVALLSIVIHRRDHRMADVAPIARPRKV